MVQDAQHDFESALLLGAAVVVALWVLWCGVVLLVALVNRDLAARLLPPLLRGILTASTCVATAVPASALPPRPLDGLRLPDRPDTGAVRFTAATRDKPPADRTYLVRSGDSLWSIARTFEPDANDAAVATAVAGWYAANLRTIGPNPDLIQPGQRLTPPGAP